MILAFPAFRRGFLKVLGSSITEALRRDHRVFLYWSSESKAGEDVNPRELVMRWPDAQLAENRPACDAVIGDPSIGEIALPHHAPRYALDFVWENRMRPRTEGVIRCWATEHHREMFRSAGPVEPIIGTTALDALPLVDPAAVRKRYDFGDRPVVVLFSPKLAIPHLWRRTVFRFWYYPPLLYALQDYCRKRGALLVVKTREKHHDPNLVHVVADRVIGDESLWPYTSAELVRVASLVVHFQSGAVLEAAAAGVPQLSIALPQPHLARYPGHDYIHSTDPYRTHHWPGVVQSAGYAEAVEVLRGGHVMEAVDMGERERYAQTYIGPLDGQSAARVLDVVEARAC